MWLIPIVSRILVANILCAYLLKLVTTRFNLKTENRTRWLGFIAIQFSVCFLIAATYAIVFGEFALDYQIVILGVFNAFAVLCLWKAVDENQAKASIFTYWDDLVGMSLALWFLGEGNYINSNLLLGIILSFAALIGFVANEYRRKDKKVSSLSLYAYIAGYSLIWGVAFFAMRYWSKNGLPVGSFMLSWYGGSIVGAGSGIVFKRGAIDELRQMFRGSLMENARKYFILVLLSIGVIAAMFLSILSYKIPQIMVQPLFLIGEMIFPALIGLFVFRERKSFDLFDW